VQAGERLAQRFRDITWWTRTTASACRRARSAPAAARSERSVRDLEARAAQGIHRGRVGVDVEELGGAVADQESEVCDGAASRGPVGRQARGSVPVPQRGLVALDRARAYVERWAGAQVRYEGGVFADVSLC
jgi:hypothetical protein